MVVGDDVRVGQILSNLVGNAIKFTDSGEVCVELRAIGMDRKERRLIEIHVIDTGPGIPEGRVASCFERFTRLDDSTGTKGGAGLGLGIVRQLVELMEGRITVDSEEGRGSTFRVVLPLAEHAGDAAEECLHEEGAGQGERRILLVEDERVNRMLATRMLEKLGYEVVCAVNGQEALDQLTDSDYDAVLMDVKMPVMDGLEATRRIRMLESNGRHRPIIALTAYAFAEDVERCREAGMDDLLAKPFELDDLREALSRTLGGS
jgi:CheY-like chemotaxis protein/anti-sigma regulatory factor (Ser/Thr protein kinase)